MEGYIKLHRKLIDSAVWAHPIALKIWVWCLIKARRNNGYVPVKFGRSSEIVKLTQGQFIYGRSKVEEVGINPETIRYWLNKFASEEFGMISINVTNHFSIITICNWEFYQGEIMEELPADYQLTTSQLPADYQPTTSQLPTNYQQTTTNNNDKKRKNYKKDKNVNNVEEENGGNSEAAIAGSGSVSKNDFSKGKEKNSTTRGKRGRPPAEIETFDPWLEQEEFRAAWAAWIAVRREKHNAVGPVAQRENMEHLRTLTDDMATAIAIVKYTTRGGYPMFYPLKTNNANPQKTAKNGFFNADTVNGTEHDYSITR